jgi:GDPmannose 4,6-dehydratase
MGNLNSLRDWGHARDYVRMQWLMLQGDEPRDYVIATGEQFSVRQFIDWSASQLGVTLEFQGEGVDEVGVVSAILGDLAPALKVGDTIVKVSPKYFRPSEVETLLGDPTLAKTDLGWVPTISTRDMCIEMVESDYLQAQRNVMLHHKSVNTNSIRGV